MKKEYFRNFGIIFIALLFVFILNPIQAFAYSSDDVNELQLTTAMNAFKNKIETEWGSTTLSGLNKYYYIGYMGESYVCYFSTSEPLIYPVGVEGNVYGFPILRSAESDLSLTRRTATMVISSTGTYTLPTSLTTGWAQRIINMDTTSSNPHFIAYTSFPLKNNEEQLLRGNVVIGEKVGPFSPGSDFGQYNPNPTREYSADVPTPQNLRVNHILPKGLFPTIRETQLQTTWNPVAGNLHMEIYLNYTYLNGTEKITKFIPYIKYSDNLWGSVGTHTALMESDIMQYIHDKDISTTGKTWANGKLYGCEYYYRFALQVDDIIKYGNWVKVSSGGGIGNELDKGIVTSQYDEVYLDSDGYEQKKEDSEYSGKIINNNGEVVDPTSLHSFTDYLLAIPNILAKTFDALMSLVGGLGTFGTVVGAFFVGMPLPLLGMVVGGFGFILIVVIIKVLK